MPVHPKQAAVVLLASVLSLSACAPNASSEAPAARSGSSITPVDGGRLLVEGSSEYLVGEARYEAPDLDMPDKGAFVTEPVFGTPIVRLTDRDRGEYAGPGIQNEYSRVDPENADGTLAVLRGNEGNWYLCSLAEGHELTPLDDLFEECETEPEPRWDSEDGNLLYFGCGTQLRRWDLSTGDVEVLHDFSTDVGGAAAITMRSEGEPSRDRRHWAYMVLDNEFELLAVLVYDLREDRVVGRIEAGELSDELDWVGMDETGEHVLVGWESLGSLAVYSTDMKRRLDLPEGSNAHGDEALTADGRSVWVYQNTATDHISMADLQTGVETPLLSIPFDVNTDIGLHVSGNCVETPGWVLVSTYGARRPAAGETGSWMDTQLFMLELSAEPRTWRLAHTRCYTAERAEDEPHYFFEAFASINSSGTRVHYGSNWGRMEDEYTEAYVAVLPHAWTEELPQ